MLVNPPVPLMTLLTVNVVAPGVAFRVPPPPVSVIGNAVEEELSKVNVALACKVPVDKVSPDVLPRLFVPAVALEILIVPPPEMVVAPE